MKFDFLVLGVLFFVFSVAIMVIVDNVTLGLLAMFFSIASFIVADLSDDKGGE